MKYVPKPEAELINYKFENPIRNFIILTSCLGLLVVALTLALAILIQPILLSLSPSWEHSLFSWIVPDEVQVFKEGQEVLQELIGDEAKHYSVFLLCDEEEINAAAYPGNAIIFSSELLRILKNKNSLAFILGHEYGHFKNRDLAKSMGWGLSSLIVKAVFALDSDTGSFFLKICYYSITVVLRSGQLMKLRFRWFEKCLMDLQVLLIFSSQSIMSRSLEKGF